jgi:hypothetical protein
MPGLRIRLASDLRLKHRQVVIDYRRYLGGAPVPAAGARAIATDLLPRLAE